MKKLMLMSAAVMAIAAAPAIAGEKSAEEMQAHVNEWFASADTDGNGTISKAEYTADAGNKFDQMDTDNNGELSKEEKMAHKYEKK